jgi:hypothetical protein
MKCLKVLNIHAHEIRRFSFCGFFSPAKFHSYFSLFLFPHGEYDSEKLFLHNVDGILCKQLGTQALSKMIEK